LVRLVIDRGRRFGLQQRDEGSFNRIIDRLICRRGIIHRLLQYGEGVATNRPAGAARGRNRGVDGTCIRHRRRPHAERQNHQKHRCCDYFCSEFELRTSLKLTGQKGRSDGASRHGWN
jgi:hypothetical protein